MLILFGIHFSPQFELELEYCLFLEYKMSLDSLELRMAVVHEDGLDIFFHMYLFPKGWEGKFTFIFRTDSFYFKYSAAQKYYLWRKPTISD